MNKSIEKEWALVLSGGGVKGSYEIGVWQSLIETGMDKKITAVSGTSVGALNAALFALGDFKKACEIWLSITQEDIISIDFKALVSAADNGEIMTYPQRVGKTVSNVGDNLMVNNEEISKRKLFLKLLSDIKESEINSLRAVADESLTSEQKSKRKLVLDFFNEISRLEMTKLNSSAESITLSEGKREFFIKLLKELDPLGINRLSRFIKKGTIRRIIDGNIDNYTLKNSGIKLYVTCSALNDISFNPDAAVISSALKYIVKNIRDYSDAALTQACINTLKENSRPVYFDVNETNFYAGDILTASAAFPIALEKTMINGTAYIDGGVYDNTPIKPLYELGYRRFIVVYLDTLDRIEHNLFPNSRIIEIAPRDTDFDRLKRVVTVNKRVIKEQITAGFTDGLKALALEK